MLSQLAWPWHCSGCLLLAPVCVVSVQLPYFPLPGSPLVFKILPDSVVRDDFIDGWSGDIKQLADLFLKLLLLPLVGLAGPGKLLKRFILLDKFAKFISYVGYCHC